MRIKVISMVLIFILANGSLIGCNKEEVNVTNGKSKEVALIKNNKESVTEIDDKDKNKENMKVKIKEERFEIYLNPRFGYSLSYPDKFKITKESDNGDGVELNFEDSKIIVYGSNNVLQDSAKGLYESELKEISKKNLIDSSLENRTYFIRWRDGNFIKYKKSTVGEESINSFEVVYPLSKEKEFMDIISKLSESFKTPNVDKMG